MTGLERLRELACDMYMAPIWATVRADTERKYDTSRGDRKTINDLLRAIADQIEAEQEERVTRRAEDREAAAWVREHGGLDAVKKLLDWVVGHCSTRQQLDFDFWLSGRVMHELGFEEDMADRDEVERRLLARLMPEGCEWPMVDGEPVVIGERLVGYGSGDDGYEVVGVRPACGWVLVKLCDHIHRDGGPVILEWDASKCRRPAPKALDSEGVECNVGDAVWWVHNKTGNFRIIRIEQDGKCAIHDDDADEPCGMTVPSAELTHKRPVLDADGVEIRAKETVFDKNTGEELIVTGFEDGRVWCEHRMTDADALPVRGMWSPDQLTHQRPVLDADGVEIYKGRIAYGTRGRKYRVTELCEYEPSIVHAQAIDDGELGDEFIAANTGLNSYQLDASKLTHELPDSWERLEEDAGKDPCGYFGFDGEETCGKCPASGKNCEQTMAQDLVRRCRALAERERGE